MNANKLDRFAKGEIVLHTPTQEICDKLMQWCNNNQIAWRFTVNIWNQHNDNTCLRYLQYGESRYEKKNKINYCDKPYYEKEGYKIETLSLSDFEPTEPKHYIEDGIYECLVASDKWWTVGKLYKVENGFSVDDYGNLREAFSENDQRSIGKNNVFEYYTAIDELSITIEFYGRETVAKIIKNGKTVKQAVAKCLPSDKFSKSVGSQLALARLMEKKQKEVFTPVVKEVNRIAKSGEWIKVVKIVNQDGYEFGDILQVDRLSDCKKLVWTNDDLHLLYHEEYVVLEGYNHVQ